MLSTTEAECISATHAAKEAIWIQMFLTEIACLLECPVKLLLDNKSVILVAKNDQYHPRMKNVDIWYHFIRHIIQDGLVSVTYIPTSEMVTDILMKPLLCASLRGGVGNISLLGLADVTCLWVLA